MMYMGRMSGIDFHIDSDNWFAKSSNLMENFKSHLLLDGKFCCMDMVFTTGCFLCMCSSFSYSLL